VIILAVAVDQLQNRFQLRAAGAGK
jgi:hypothetical protein